MKELPIGLEKDWESFEEYLEKNKKDWEEEGRERLREYARLLYYWSKKVNLISRSERGRLVTKHILPAVALNGLVQVVPHKRIVDIGSGAGLPGIPLKIVAGEEVEVTLVESRRKRANLLKEFTRRLELKETRIVNKRVEDWGGEEPGWDLVVMRSVGYQGVAWKRALGLLAPHGAAIRTLEPQEKRDDGCYVKKRVSWGDIKVTWGLIKKEEEKKSYPHK